MNRIKLLILLLVSLMLSNDLKAQGEIVVTGSIPAIETASCTFDENDYALAPSEVMGYLASVGVTASSDCAGGYQVQCVLTDLDETSCAYTAVRHFIFWNDCDYLDLEQPITVKKRSSIKGTLNAMTVPNSCSFNPSDYSLDEEQAVAYLINSGFEFEDECLEDMAFVCLITDVAETECAFTCQRNFMFFNQCDTEGVTISQTITMYKGYRHEEFALADITMDAASLEEGGFPGKYDTDAIRDHIEACGFPFPPCWTGYSAYYEDPVESWNSNFCERSFNVTFVIDHDDEVLIHCGLTPRFLVHQTVILSPQAVEQNGDLLGDITNIGNCEDASSTPPIEDIKDFAELGVTFSNYTHDFAFEITYVDEPQETDDCTKSEVMRTYTIDYNCSEPPFHTELTQFITNLKAIRVFGMLDTQYIDEGDEPETYETLSDLRTKVKGFNLYYSCEESDLEVSYHDETNYLGNPDMTLRWYVVKSSTCDKLKDSISQIIQTVIKEPSGFHLDGYTDTTNDDTNDGTATLSRPSYFMCEDCAGCPERQLFMVRWTNLTEDKIYETDPTDEACNIYFIDSLCGGKYKVEVFPICGDEGVDQSSPIFSDNFEIKAAKTDLYVTFGVRYYSFGCYASAFGLHLYKYDYSQLNYTPDEDFFPCDPPEGVHYDGSSGLESLTGYRFHHGYTIDIHSSKHLYRWDIEGGTTDFDYNELHSAGSDYGMTFEEWVAKYQAEYQQHFTVAKGTKGMPRAFIFKMYNFEGDKLLKSKREEFFHEELKCSNDPNEIFGPSGYTNADSTIVQMINATDDLNYTIQFENDPEFATAAAARVKITCPLDDHADPTTFRLGNFGFGSYTFEVPPMASYYNNRIIIDSLDFWLDVTASIAVPENEAYWIFQTIDPATGVAPIDSLGFLPVNDTLVGNGEGFVTFTVSPKPGENKALIQTNDSIVEVAEIIFDENEVVPTNRYKNVFDATAPTSVIVCDTTGAFANRVLNIGFDASDDAGGSGVQYINLYASIDRNGFELVGTIQPDSIFAYPLVNGSHFEFIGLATDNVGNKEPNKSYPELTYSFGVPPTDLKLDNKVFAENDVIGTLIGNFSTVDDQNTDFFVYSLVDGAGSDDNSMFRIEDNQLKTNYDFRCYGTYEYNIRVRTTDVTSEYLEKAFVLSATPTEEIQTVYKDENLCPGQKIYFGGEDLTTAGVYWDTLSTVHGCDSIVCLRVTMLPAPVTTLVNDEVCFGEDYTDNGFDLTAENLAVLASGWTMESDYVLYLDNYVENLDGCSDTTRLTLTLHPSYESVTNAEVCQSDLPYVFFGMPFFEDTVVVRDLRTVIGCDSTVVLNLTVNPYSTQSKGLNQGWNWYSTYIDQRDGQGLADLEEALGTQGVLIKSQSEFVQYYPDHGIWYGSLKEIDNKSTYMIQTNGNVTANLLGCYSDDDTITLRPGWSWIGYPVPNDMYLSQISTAISGYPSDGDLIKSNQGFSIYDADHGMWSGSLSVLHPGDGLMYNSLSTGNKYIYYPNHSRVQGQLIEIPEVHWTHNIHQYAENITIVGLIELDGAPIESDSLEVGVFCNGEGRGSGRAFYLPDLDAFRIFLTVHGEEGDQLEFRLFDHNRDKERRIRCAQQLTFHADDRYGDLRNPYLIHFGTDYDKLIVAEICEGHCYEENGFHVCQPGTYFHELIGKQGNDSIVRLDLFVNPAFYEERTVVAVEFPFLYDDLTFDRPGTYSLPYETMHGCDSIMVYQVVPSEGARELLVSPVPANTSQRVTLFFPFTRAEQQGLKVEVYTLTGSLLQTVNPTNYPIELNPFPTAGTYMVKITMGTGEVLAGKIIVKH